MRHFLYTPRSGSKIIYSRPTSGVVRVDLTNGSHVIYCPLPTLNIAAHGQLRSIVARLLNRTTPSATVAADVQGDITIYTANLRLPEIMREICARQVVAIPELSRVVDALDTWEETLSLLGYDGNDGNEGYYLHPFLELYGSPRIQKGRYLLPPKRGEENPLGEIATSEAAKDAVAYGGDDLIWFHARETLRALKSRFSKPPKEDPQTMNEEALSYFLSRTPILPAYHACFSVFHAMKGGGGTVRIGDNEDWAAYVAAEESHEHGNPPEYLLVEWAKRFGVKLQFHNYEDHEVDPFCTLPPDQEDVAYRGEEVPDEAFFTWAQANAHKVPDVEGYKEAASPLNWGCGADMVEIALSRTGGNVGDALALLEQRGYIPRRSEYENYFAPHFPPYVAPAEEEEPAEEKKNDEPAPRFTEEERGEALRVLALVGVSPLPCGDDGIMEAVERLDWRELHDESFAWRVKEILSEWRNKLVTEGEKLYLEAQEEIIALSHSAPFPPSAGEEDAYMVKTERGWVIESQRFLPRYIPNEMLVSHVRHLRMLRQMAEVMRSQQT